MSVSPLMIDKFHQNLGALKVHCFCDCKERRHYRPIFDDRFTQIK